MNIRKITPVAIPLLLLILALIFGSGLLLRIFFLSAIVIAFSYVWVLFGLRKLKLTTAPPSEHLQVGDNFGRQVTILNESRFPQLWLSLKDNTNLPGEHDETMMTIPGRKTYSCQSRFLCRQRGHFHLGPMTTTVSDPFGLFKRQRSLGSPQDIIVFPATVDLPHFKFSSFSDFGYGSGYQSISRISPNASSVREYVSGDSLQHIHWRSTARIGKVMVKMFDADRSYNASKTGWLILDMNNSSHAGTGEDTSVETAMTVASSIIKKYVRDGMRVGLMASDRERFTAVPERNEEHLWRLLEALALMQTGREQGLSEILSRNIDYLRDNPLVIIIATSASSDLVDAVHQLRNRVDSVVVVLLDAGSWNGHHLSADVIRSLTWTGAQVYIVKKDDELSKALDSKTTRVYPVMV